MASSSQLPSASEASELVSDLGPVAYSDLHAVFTANDEDGLRKLIKVHGAQALVDVRDVIWDDNILRHISDSHEFHDQDRTGLAKILLDSLESDAVRYEAIVIAVGYEHTPLASVVVTENIPLMKLYLDIIGNAFSVHTLSYPTHFNDEPTTFIKLVCRYSHHAHMWKLCVQASERVKCPNELYNLYNILLRECRFKCEREHDPEMLGPMIDTLFASLERIYCTYPNVVDILFTKLYHSPNKLVIESTHLHYAVTTNCVHLVTAILQLCESKYADMLLTTVDSRGRTPMKLAQVIVYERMVNILSDYTLTKSCK